MSVQKTCAQHSGVAPEQIQYLTFMLADEEYGVDILRVQEIKGWDRITRVPHTAKFILGVMNLRGAVVPIMDLRSRFGLEGFNLGPTTAIVVVRAAHADGERIVGLVVDAVSEVYRIDVTAAQPPPVFCATGQTPYVKAIATVAEKMLILLDVDSLIGNSIMDAASPGTAVA